MKTRALFRDFARHAVKASRVRAGVPVLDIAHPRRGAYVHVYTIDEAGGGRVVVLAKGAWNTWLRRGWVSRGRKNPNFHAYDISITKKGREYAQA